jgi:hypothetical protein
LESAVSDSPVAAWTIEDKSEVFFCGSDAQAAASGDFDDRLAERFFGYFHDAEIDVAGEILEFTEGGDFYFARYANGQEVG